MAGYTPNFMNNRYSPNPYLPPINQPNSFAVFLNAFSQSLLPIIQYKMKEQADLDVYGKKLKMEEEYKKRNMSPEEMFAADRYGYINELKEKDPEAYRLLMQNNGNMPDWYGKPAEPKSSKELLIDWVMNGGAGPAPIGGDVDRDKLTYGVLQSEFNEPIADALTGYKGRASAIADAKKTATRESALTDAIGEATQTGVFPTGGIAGETNPFATQAGKYNNVIEEYMKNSGGQIGLGVSPAEGTPASLTTRGRQKIAENAAGRAPLPQEVAGQRAWWVKKGEEDKRTAARAQTIDNLDTRAKAIAARRGISVDQYWAEQGRKGAEEKPVTNPEDNTSVKLDVLDLFRDIAIQTEKVGKDGKVLINKETDEPIYTYSVNPEMSKNEIRQTIQQRLKGIRDSLIERKFKPLQIKVYLDEYKRWARSAGIDIDSLVAQ